MQYGAKSHSRTHENHNVAKSEESFTKTISYGLRTPLNLNRGTAGLTEDRAGTIDGSYDAIQDALESRAAARERASIPSKPPQDQ